MKELITKILVPIDGSDSSRKALKFALKLAFVSKAKLILLEVVEEFGPLPGYYEAAPAGKDRAKWIANQRFEKIEPLLEDTNVKWERVVEEGYPADTICQVAKKQKVDMIVIGSRGLSGLSRFLVGSVSDRVVHHAECNVTIVR